uniref:Uncharacterized protein n=1 Tax=Rhizochromulina marina TaxID=1034831 RepID=A0A7S2SM85_9STRA|mmetsp:Transcript_32469/g.94083  ORF Transcript_32469/g.94083 Transcript_32469/m.94083 type:complete len:146 (+) Transcript_32469:18-455(+)
MWDKIREWYSQVGATWSICLLVILQVLSIVAYAYDGSVFRWFSARIMANFLVILGALVLGFLPTVRPDRATTTVAYAVSAGMLVVYWGLNLVYMILFGWLKLLLWVSMGLTTITIALVAQATADWYSDEGSTPVSERSAESAPLV